VIDVRAELQLVSETFVKGGYTQYWKGIPLVRADLWQIEGYNKSDEHGYYAFRFRTFEDIHNLWTNDRDFLRLRVQATDSLSGYRKVFVMNYAKDDLVEGRFAAGDSFDVIRPNANVTRT